MNADAAVMEFMPKRLTAEESDVLADRIQKRLAERGFGLFAAELRETGSFIGFVGLSVPAFEAHFTPCVEIGWRLAREFWGLGYATEGAYAVLRLAFMSLELPEVRAESRGHSGRWRGFLLAAPRALLPLLRLGRLARRTNRRPGLPERQYRGAVGAGLRRRGAGHRRRPVGAGRTAQRPAPAPLPAAPWAPRPRRRWASAMRCWAPAARRWWCGAATAPAPSPMAAATQLLQSCLKGADALALSERAGRSVRSRRWPSSFTVHDAHGRKLVARGRAVGGMAAVWLEEPPSPAASRPISAPSWMRCPFRSGCATRAWR